MAVELLEVACGCCELCLSLAEAGSSGGKKAREKAAEESADPALDRRRDAYVARNAREHKRGVRIEFEKRHVSDVVILAGPQRGRRASEMDDMKLKRLALSMKNRVARFALRRYLRHRKKGRAPPPPSEPVIRR